MPGIDLKLVLSNLMITSRPRPPQHHGQRTVLTSSRYQITPRLGRGGSPAAVPSPLWAERVGRVEAQREREDTFFLISSLHSHIPDTILVSI